MTGERHTHHARSRLGVRDHAAGNLPEDRDRADGVPIREAPVPKGREISEDLAPLLRRIRWIHAEVDDEHTKEKPPSTAGD